MTIFFCDLNDLMYKVCKRAKDCSPLEIGNVLAIQHKAVTGLGKVLLRIQNPKKETKKKKKTKTKRNSREKFILKS